jgi:hypothetical protein
LPLSEKEDVPEHYGTRHRAALGLSEVTDAVCLVVSEERSEVSTVVAGTLTTWPDPDTLAEKLKEWVEGPVIHVPKLKQFFKEAFVHNWRMKLGALVLVTLAWLILAIQQEMIIDLTAPIRYTNIPAELKMDDGSPKSVGLTLAGRRHRIGELNKSDLTVRVDLSELSSGDHFIQLTTGDIDLPMGVALERITPQNLQIKLRPRLPQQGGKLGF